MRLPDAAPALSGRGPLPRAGKRLRFVLSLRSPPRRVRMRVGDTCQAHRCDGGFQGGADHTPGTRRAESLRPFSAPVHRRGAARASLQRASAGQGRRCVTGSPVLTMTVDVATRRAEDGAALAATGLASAETAVGARRRTCEAGTRPERFRAATSQHVIRAVLNTPVASVRLADVAHDASLSRRGSGAQRESSGDAFSGVAEAGRRPDKAGAASAAVTVDRPTIS